MTSIDAMCKSLLCRFTNDTMFVIAQAAVVTPSNVGLSCACCGATVSVQDGMYDKIGIMVSESKIFGNSQEGTSSCAMPPPVADAVMEARRLRAKLRLEISVIFQSGILYLLAATVMLFQQFMDGKLAEPAGAASLVEDSATRRFIGDISQALQRREKMRLRDRKRGSQAWHRNIHLPRIRARRHPA